MPMYLWKCSKCEGECEVIRPIAEYQAPPTEEDSPPECTAPEHTWERRIPSGSGQFHLVGYGWARDGYR